MNFLKYSQNYLESAIFPNLEVFTDALINPTRMGREFAKRVKNVAVILSSSRSGSSVFAKILSAHQDVAAMSGEMEPFLSLSANGFPYSSQSDAIVELANKDLLLDLIWDDLTIPSLLMCEKKEIKERWRKRLLLQFPQLFSDPARYGAMLAALDGAISSLKQSDKNEKDIHRQILSEIFRDTPSRIHYYDSHSPELSCPIQYFNEEAKLEEPPFISPRLYTRRISEKDAAEKLLLFKSPQDSYRIGIYKQLFPNANIIHLHLHRGYAQTVNGLMDGWLSPKGFFSHNIQKTTGISLGIKGYSDCTEFGKAWWKFDLPPNWKKFTGRKLMHVCLNQWMSAHRAILSSDVKRIEVSFEEFLNDPQKEVNRITRHLGLRQLRVEGLPVVMATKKPEPQRWRVREKELLSLAKRMDVREMMDSLHHSMDTENWR